MTEITKFEEQADHGPLGAVPWWRQRLFVAKGWTYHIDTLGIAPLDGEAKP